MRGGTGGNDGFGRGIEKLQEQIAAWPMERRFVVQQLIEDYSNIRKDLLAYKNTGLTPEQCENAKAIIESAFSDDTSKAERIRELLKADRAGRLVVLPCKVGDTVYFRTYDCNGTVDLGIQPHKVTAIVGHAIVRGKYTDVGLLPGQYGVSWFLTREAAEKALEAKRDGSTSM